MKSQIQNDIERSQRVLQEAIEHREMFGIPESLWLLTDDEYRVIGNGGAFVCVDHHDCLRHEFSGEIIASTQEQVDILIENLKELRKKMAPALDCTKKDL